MGLYQGLFISKKIDLTDITINDVVLDVINSNGAKVTFAFMQAGVWCNVDGKALPTQCLTSESLLAEGTLFRDITTTKLSAMLAVPDFQFAVAMRSVRTPTPSLNFGVYTKQHLVELSKVVESLEYSLGGNIVKKDYDGSSNALLEVNGYKHGRWLGWCDIGSLDNDCEKVKFRVTCKVNSVGEESVFNTVRIFTRPESYKVLSESGNIYLDSSHSDYSLILVGNECGTTRVYCCPNPSQLEETVTFTGASAEQAVKLPDTADFSTIKAVNTESAIPFTYDTEKKEVYVNSSTNGSITYKVGGVDEKWRLMSTDNDVVWYNGDGKVKIELTSDHATVSKTYSKAGCYPLDAIEVNGAEYANGVVLIPNDNTTITYTRPVNNPTIKGVVFEKRR